MDTYAPEPEENVFGRRPRRILIAVGAVLCAFTALNLAVGNTSLGTFLPLLAGLPVLAAGIFFYPLYTWAAVPLGRAVVIMAAILYMFAGAVLLISSVRIASALLTPVPPGADAVVILGAAVHGDEVTDTLEKRLLAAMEYYEENPGTVLVVSGGMGSGENLSEAAAMKKYLLDHGIPEEVILSEEQAASTRENFRYAKNLLDAHFGGRPYRIVFATSDFHVLRAQMDAQEAGFSDSAGIGAPTPILTVPGAWMRESAALFIQNLS